HGGRDGEGDGVHPFEQLGETTACPGTVLVRQRGRSLGPAGPHGAQYGVGMVGKTGGVHSPGPRPRADESDSHPRVHVGSLSHLNVDSNGPCARRLHNVQTAGAYPDSSMQSMREREGGSERAHTRPRVSAGSAAVVVVPVVVRVLVPVLVLVAVVGRLARQLTLQCIEVRGGNAVLELPGHFCLLGLSSAAPHGSTPLHRGGAAGGNRRPRVVSTTFPTTHRTVSKGTYATWHGVPPLTVSPF